MIDSTNPRVMADNIRELSNTQAAQGAALEAEIEALQIYDDAETDTGMKWIDGLPIYRLVVDSGALSAGSSDIDLSVSNINLIKLWGVAVAGQYQICFPYISSALTWAISASIYGNKLHFSVGSSYADSNAISDSFVVIEYTKSTVPSSLTAPAPDDTRSIEPEVREPEPETEPINEEPKKEEK